MYKYYGTSPFDQVRIPGCSHAVYLREGSGLDWLFRLTRPVIELHLMNGFGVAWSIDTQPGYGIVGNQPNFFIQGKQLQAGFLKKGQSNLKTELHSVTGLV